MKTEMKAVSENSTKEMARNRALEDLRWPMKELAANLIRVTRGAGRAYELPQQMVAVLDCISSYREAVGHYPSDSELSDMINIRCLEPRGHREDIAYATDRIVQGALQAAASRLLGQSTQESAGERELFDGVRDLESAREQYRKRHFGTRAERASIAEQDRITEELRQRAENLASRKPRKK